MSQDSKTATAHREISYDAFFSKTMGAWYGKTIGGTIGAPFEVHKILGHDVTEENCWPSEIIPNDDLDIQIVWLEALEERGMWLSHADLVDLWRERCWYNFSEYGIFLHNVQRGIYPPTSGSFNNEYYRESMGCPIRSEIWAIVAFGNPALAAELALMDGELDHVGESIYCEQFWAAAQAEAFFTSSFERALAVGLNFVPVGSKVHEIATEVPRLWQEHGDVDFLWRRLNRSYGDRDGSKALINFALQLLAYYANPRDFRQMMVDCARFGYDVDSTAATVGALFGLLHGYEALPVDWCKRLGDRLACGINVKHRTAGFKELTLDTLKVAVEMTMTRNPLNRISDLPPSLENEVKSRVKGRPARPLLLTAEYPQGPALSAVAPTEILLRLANNSDEPQKGSLSLKAENALKLSVSNFEVELPARSSQNLSFLVSQPAGEKVIFDKNLVHVSWKGSHAFQRDFGLGGSRQYMVYGPYWDAYDTTKFAENPFRHGTYRCHPLQIPGIPLTRVHVHNFARLDRPYLDEKLLLSADIPAEDPLWVESPEDCLKHGQLGGFVGEACYYLTREVMARETQTCTVWFGSINPFILWIDGVEKLRSETCDTWGYQEHSVDVEFGPKPRRIVIKVAKQIDDFRLALAFLRKEFPKDGTGWSYLTDTLGDIVPASSDGKGH